MENRSRGREQERCMTTFEALCLPSALPTSTLLSPRLSAKNSSHGWAIKRPYQSSQNPPTGITRYAFVTIFRGHRLFHFPGALCVRTGCHWHRLCKIPWESNLHECRGVSRHSVCWTASRWTSIPCSCTTGHSTYQINTNPKRGCDRRDEVPRLLYSRSYWYGSLLFNNFLLIWLQPRSKVAPGVRIVWKSTYIHLLEHNKEKIVRLWFQ